MLLLVFGASMLVCVRPLQRLGVSISAELQRRAHNGSPFKPVAPDAPVTFGPVIVRVLSDPDWTKPESCLGLDTGVVFNPGNPRQKGIDLMSDSSGKSIQVFDLVFVPFQNDQFESLTPAAVVDGIRGATTLSEPMETLTVTNPPSTFGFKTRESGLGMLQITGFTEDLRAVSVRYKLIQPPGAPPLGPTNRVSGIARTTQAVVQQQAQTKLSAMKSRLRLTEDQEQAVRALLEKKLALAGELSTKMTEGGFSKEEMDKADRTIQEIDRQLKEVLTPQQWADYDASQIEERRTQAQFAANVELMQLQPVLQLSQAQRAQVLQHLTRLHEQQLAKTFDGLKIPLDWELQLADIKDALRPVLTGEQIQSLEKWLDLQRETIKATLSNPTISNSSRIPKQASPAS